MIFLRQVLKFIELLHSETAGIQLAGGIVLGMFMGFTPVLTLYWAFYILVCFAVRVNLGAVFLSFPVFAFLSFFLDPVFDATGRWFLGDATFLRGLWTFFYQLPIIPYTRFNNSIVFGSVFWAKLLALPLFFISLWLIARYREVVVERFRGSKLGRLWKASKLYALYEKYRSLKAST